jgi:glucans biosynthesis protein C
LYALALPLGINEAVLKPLFPEAHNLVSDWYIFNHYLLFTLYGFVLASMPNVWPWIAARRHALLATGAAIYLVVTILKIKGMYDRDDIAVDAFVAAAFTWACVLAFIGYGYQHLSFSNLLLRWARDASYPIYILHQTVIVAIGYYVIQAPWSPWVKYWTVLVATMVSCGLLYEFAVRRFGIARVIFGMKPERPKAVPNAEAAAV